MNKKYDALVKELQQINYNKTNNAEIENSRKPFVSLSNFVCTVQGFQFYLQVYDEGNQFLERNWRLLLYTSIQCIE